MYKIDKMVVKWSRPPAGWTKLNSDGWASTGNGSTGYEGVLRSYQGASISGYACHMGACSVNAAEAWGILSGLKVAVKKGVRRIVVESNSKKVQCIRGVDRLETDDQNLIEACVRELRNFSKVEIAHVVREQNKAADAIAKLAETHAPELTVYEEPPPRNL